ncbi:MAG: sugar ABC transporter ATP-binding protein [Candidatus Humimicrobiaceae bacterium]
MLLSIKNLSKTFPGVKALSSVNFDLKDGEVHALIGENGAGKSTFIKIINGIVKKDEGEIEINGKIEDIKDSHHARSLGIGAIFQELSLVPTLSVAENIFLGHEIRKGKLIIDKKSMVLKTEELLEKFGIMLNPRSIISEISQAQRQLTEILKALSLNPKIFIMDEPTSALAENETNILFKIIENVKGSNASIGIIYISHKLDEVFHIADRLTIFRDGKNVGSYNKEEFNMKTVINLMVGREIELYKTNIKSINEKEEIKLEVKNLTRHGVFNNVSFKLYKGEILGIGGLVGSGRSEVAKALFGIDKIDSGNIILNGEEIKINSPKDAIKKGIVLLPENRQLQGLILIHNIKDNIYLPIFDKFITAGLINNKHINSDVKNRISEFDIKATSANTIVKNLSGGNQQKVCLAKWLSINPDVLIIDEPTIGIDVKTKSEIHKLLRNLTKKGTSIIMITSEMPELLAHSDQVMVMNNGKVLGIFENKNLTQEILMKTIMDDILKNKKV